MDMWNFVADWIAQSGPKSPQLVIFKIEWQYLKLKYSEQFEIFNTTATIDNNIKNNNAPDIYANVAGASPPLSGRTRLEVLANFSKLQFYSTTCDWIVIGPIWAKLPVLASKAYIVYLQKYSYSFETGFKLPIYYIPHILTKFGTIEIVVSGQIALKTNKTM